LNPKHWGEQTAKTWSRNLLARGKEAPSNFIIRQTVPQLDVYLGAAEQYGMGLSPGNPTGLPLQEIHQHS